MSRLSTSNDILSLTELRAHLTTRIDALSQGTDCLVITRKGRAAAVILSPAEYDRLCYGSFVREKIAKGAADIATGRTRSHDRVMAEAQRVASNEKD